MKKALSRRDFLRLMTLVTPNLFLSKFMQDSAGYYQKPEAPNVLIVLFDALAARHLPFYGYERATTPNLAKIVERATVYHNHYSGGNWTTPGTATLLTGTYPWTHRAFSQRDMIAKDKADRNIFRLCDQYYRVAYSHNSIPNRFFEQFSRDIEYIKHQKALFTANNLSLDRFFPWDNDIASLSWDRIVKKGEKEYTYSPLFARIYEIYSQDRENVLLDSFPRGIPHTGEDDYFLLEDGIDWLLSRITTFQQPFLGYFHYLPPHRPYNTRRDFVDAFKDDNVGYYIEKPRHPLFSQGNPEKPLNLTFQSDQRRFYDEFILYLDAEFGRLYNSMEQNGLLENTWIIFTSDHGESFERGIFGHRTPTLYQPVVRIPLVILEPRQTEKRDVFTPTSAVDVLPTVLRITGKSVPDWVEGHVLPPYSEVPPVPERSIYALEATKSKKYEPLSIATVMLVKGKYKLTYYFGYQELVDKGPMFELYDLENDPEELNNIYSDTSEIAQTLKEELLEKIAEVDKPFEKR